MLTVSVVAWTFIALGLVAAPLVGYRIYRHAGWAQPLFLVFASLAIGLAARVRVPKNLGWPRQSAGGGGTRE